jgi:hypothetical protein
MNSQDTTLGDFVQQLLRHLGGRELHLKDERPWHEMFYRLKTSPEVPGKPQFLQGLFFSWNGPYPKCEELSEYLHALHWSGCVAAANPGYDRFTLNPSVANLWETDVDQDLEQFISEAARAAENNLVVV